MGNEVFKYKVINSDLQWGSKSYKEGAVLISSTKLNHECLEEIVPKNIPNTKPTKKRQSRG